MGKQNESVFFKYDKEDPEDTKTGWVKKQEIDDQKTGYTVKIHQKPSDSSVNLMRLQMVLKGISKKHFWSIFKTLTNKWTTKRNRA